MLERNQGGKAEGRVAGAGQSGMTPLRVLPHCLHFIRGKRTSLLKIRDWDKELSNVVKGCRLIDLIRIIRGETQLKGY
jgi:hypothetical protein